MTDNMKLSSPWVVYYRKLEALFGEDPEIRVEYDNDAPAVKLFVDNPSKVDALTKLLPEMVVFGNTMLRVTIIPANTEASKISLIRDAFNGNPAFSFSETTYALDSNPIHYVVFKNKVVQYHNDDLGDYYGNCSTLYQELAKELIGETEGVHFCTDLP